MTEEVRPLRKHITLAALVAALLLPGTALAHQTEADTQDLRHQLHLWLKWDGMVERRVQEQAARVAARKQAAREAAEAEAAAEAAAPTTTSYPSGGSAGALSADQVASLARGAGFPENLISTMVAIAWRESGYRPGAVNPSSGACGLWQMYPCPGPSALNPATNAAMAYAKYVGAGHSLSPWGY